MSELHGAQAGGTIPGSPYKKDSEGRTVDSRIETHKPMGGAEWFLIASLVTADSAAAAGAKMVTEKVLEGFVETKPYASLAGWAVGIAVESLVAVGIYLLRRSEGNNRRNRVEKGEDKY